MYIHTYVKYVCMYVRIYLGININSNILILVVSVFFANNSCKYIIIRLSTMLTAIDLFNLNAFTQLTTHPYLKNNDLECVYTYT